VAIYSFFFSGQQRRMHVPTFAGLLLLDRERCQTKLASTTSSSPLDAAHESNEMELDHR
jgi:hypothetical protein